jgi:signal recognition particle GTPase
MGDILSLIERREEVGDKKESEELQEKDVFRLLYTGRFPRLVEADSQARSLDQILGMLPSIGPFKRFA